MSTPRKWAIAVREQDGRLLVVSTVVRAAAGDIYVNWPRPYAPDWKPHASYHASGQHHQKAHNSKMQQRVRQRPDGNFAGVENVVTFGIAAGEAAALNQPCVAADYDDTFEIPAMLLGSLVTFFDTTSALRAGR